MKRLLLFVGVVVAALTLAGCVVPQEQGSPDSHYPFSVVVACGGTALHQPPAWKTQVAKRGRELCDRPLNRIGRDFTATNELAGRRVGLSAAQCLVTKTPAGWRVAPGVKYCFPRVIGPTNVFAAMPVHTTGDDPSTGATVTRLDGAVRGRERPVFFIEQVGQDYWLYNTLESSCPGECGPHSDSVVQVPVRKGFVPQYAMKCYLPSKQGAWVDNKGYYIHVSTVELNDRAQQFARFLTGYAGRTIR